MPISTSLNVLDMMLLLVSVSSLHLLSLFFLPVHFVDPAMTRRNIAALSWILAQVNVATALLVVCSHKPDSKRRERESNKYDGSSRHTLARVKVKVISSDKLLLLGE